MDALDVRILRAMRVERQHPGAQQDEAARLHAQRDAEQVQSAAPRQRLAQVEPMLGLAP